MTKEDWILATDLAILAFLVFTWFYEGHHRRCRVEVLCFKCGKVHEKACAAEKIKHKKPDPQL